MRLTGNSSRQLQKALLDAYPSKGSLAQMLKYYLDKNLETVAGGDNLSEIVFNLIENAEAEGWVGELISKAREDRPGNEALRDFVEDFRGDSDTEGCGIDRVRLECAGIRKEMLGAPSLKELRHAKYKAEALLDECPKHRPEIRPLIDDICKAIKAEKAHVLALIYEVRKDPHSIKWLRAALHRVKALVSEFSDHPDIVAPARQLEDEIEAAIRKVWLRRLLLSSASLLVVLASLYLFLRGCNGPPPDRPEMILIPAGTFQIGTSQKELQSLLADFPDWKESMYINEAPREVNLPEFFISKFEVTNEQYRDFLKENSGYRDIQKLGPPNQPVVNVSWDDAVAYCEWLSKVTGKRYRLPTEAEWERSARGSDGRRFPWGNDRPSNESAIFSNEPIESVGSKRKDSSPYGVRDMAGNVAEWCYDNGYDGSRTKAVRGGSWRDPAFYLRCAARKAYRGTEGRDDLGFRVAMDSPNTVR